MKVVLILCVNTAHTLIRPSSGWYLIQEYNCNSSC